MADEVEMTPVAGAEPPKANPLGKPVAAGTVKLNPVVRKPGTGGAPTAGLKPGLKLPPKPGLATGLKLPPKPGATVSALRPGLKLPTQNALKPGVKLPPKPVIRKPGAATAAAPLPKPVVPKPVADAKPVEASAAAAAPAQPVEPPKPVPPPAAAAPKPVAVDAQGIGKLPTVSATAIARGDAVPDVGAMPKPMEALKSVTQKLKGITQEIPQQAILHKTGIIAEGGVSDAQKEAAKHKTARISLSDAMGVAPVKNESAPMKTIRIKRPINIPTQSTLTPQAKPAEAPAAAAPAPAAPAAEAAASTASAPAPTVTQRKTLKIARPGGIAVRPGGKFGIKRPGSAPTAAQPAPAADGSVASLPADDAIADIPEMPTNVSAIPTPVAAAPASDGPAWLWALSAVIQAAACVAIGALAWFLYTNTQTQYF